MPAPSPSEALKVIGEHFAQINRYSGLISGTFEKFHKKLAEAHKLTVDQTKEALKQSVDAERLAKIHLTDFEQQKGRSQVSRHDYQVTLDDYRIALKKAESEKIYQEKTLKFVEHRAAYMLKEETLVTFLAAELDRSLHLYREVNQSLINANLSLSKRTEILYDIF